MGPPHISLRQRRAFSLNGNVSLELKVRLEDQERPTRDSFSGLYCYRRSLVSPGTCGLKLSGQPEQRRFVTKPPDEV